MATTKSLVQAFHKHAEAVNRFREINAKKFDDMRGGSALLSSVKNIESLVENTEHLLDRHDHFVIKAADAARVLRAKESRARAERRSAESLRQRNHLSSSPDQFHLHLHGMESFTETRATV